MFLHESKSLSPFILRVSEDKSLQEVLGVYLDPLSCDAIKRQQ